jgi:ribosomal protein S18 acetylase RimI-like enzyme
MTLPELPTHHAALAADYRIVLEQQPSMDDCERVLAGLRAHNRRRAAAPDFAPLALFLRDGANAVVGGLVGETGWGWLHVQLLWVDEELRGRGFGRRLLRAAEAEAWARGARHAYLDTLDFQAPSFYEREGYAVFGVQEDYPPGHRRFFLRKPLTNAGPRGAHAPDAGTRGA